jgi:hypothetical protein
MIKIVRIERMFSVEKTQIFIQDLRFLAENILSILTILVILIQKFSEMSN